MKQLLFLSLVFALSSTFSFAQVVVQATGTAATQKEAQDQALQALASQLKVSVVSEKTSTKIGTADELNELYSSKTSAKTDLTLLGVKFEAKKTSAGWEVSASLDKSAAPAYQDKITTLTKSIQSDLTLSDAQPDTEDKITLLLSIQTNLALRDGYITVARQLGVKTFPKLDLTDNLIKQKILAVEHANQQKLEMSIEPLVTKVSLSSAYAERISSEIRSGIVDMNRFDVKDTKNTSQTLKVRLTKNDVTTQPSTSDSYGYCTVDLSLVLEIQDNRSKKMLTSKEVRARGSDFSNKQRSYDVDIATREAVSVLISRALETLEATFIIQARLVTKEPSGVLVLSKGSDVGIKQGMDFEIYDPNDRVQQTKLALLRVSDVSATTSKGRVYRVFRADLPFGPGFSLKESKTDNGFQAIVVKRGYSDVYLNVGKKMNVSQGDYFVVVSGDEETLIDPATNLPIQTESSTHGRVQITQVYEDYSIAKIEEGVFSIQPKDTVRQIRRGPFVFRISASDTIGVFEVTENKNRTSTGLYYGTDSGGSQTETSTKYMVHLVRASFGVVDELRNYYADLGIKYANLASAPGLLGTDIRLGYEVPFVPGYLGAFAEGNLGFVLATQNAGYASSGSFYKAENGASSVGFDLEARLGVTLSLAGFSLRPAVGVSSIGLSKWSYDANAGGTTASMKETSIVRYPQITASPLAFSVAADFTF